MEAIRTIQDFKDFMNANYNNIYSNAIKAEELTLEAVSYTHLTLPTKA